jgi:hypothetical protein
VSLIGLVWVIAGFLKAVESRIRRLSIMQAHDQYPAHAPSFLGSAAVLCRMKKLHGASSPSNLEFDGTVIIMVNDVWLDLNLIAVLGTI